MLKYILYYYLIVNLILLVVMFWDKGAAIKNWRRVPENTLMFLALIGGAIGGLLGMGLGHHKTRKIKFWLVYIGALVLHILAIYGLNQIGII